ncbi:MAG: ATP-binding protein [Saprospiraceae bacterium]
MQKLFFRDLEITKYYKFAEGIFSFSKVLFFSCLLFPCYVTAQEYTENIRFFNAKDGLSDNTILTGFQDKTGFIWIGTRFGLSRFDGYEFKNWKGKSQGHNFERISRIGQDDAGWLWLWNDEGLLFLDPLTETILSETERFKEGIPFDTQLKTLGSWKYWKKKHISVDEDGRLYFIANNPNKLITYTEKEGFLVYPIAEKRPLSSIRVTANKNVWVTVKDMESSIIQLNQKGGFIKEYKPERGRLFSIILETADGILYNTKTPDKKDNSPVYCIDNNGTVEETAAISFGGGNMFYNKTNRQLFTEVDDNWQVYDADYNLIKKIRTEKYPNLRMATHFSLSDRQGKNWQGTDWGLIQMTLALSHFENYFSFEETDQKPYNNSARGMFVLDDDLYVNFEMGGLTKIKVDTADLNNWQLLNQKEGSSYIQSENKRFRYWGRPILPSKKEKFWVGSDESLRKHALSGQIIEEYPLNHPEKKMAQKDIWAIYEDEQENTWIGTGNGLAIKRFASEAIEYVPIAAKWRLDQAIIFNIIPEHNFLYWLCTSEGLYLFDAESESIKERYHNRAKNDFLLPVQNIRHLYKDKDNIYWLATTEGLLRWNKITGEKRRFNRSDGLVGEILAAVYEDNFNHLWMSSDKSIMQMNKTDFSIKVYLPKDGTQQEYNRIAHYQDSAENIYFGGMNGVTKFNPADFHQEQANYKADAPLVISEYQHYDGAKNEILTIPCGGEKKLSIDLKPDDRFFTLKMSPLNYEEAAINNYAYKIEGLDKTWVNQESRQFWFGRLPYGTHAVHLKSTNKRNYAQSKLTVNVNVLKPVYLRTWFLLLMASLVIFLAYLFSKWRIYRLEKQKKLLKIEIVKATTKIRADKTLIEAQANSLSALNRTKDQLFSIISHDLRRPALAFRGISKKVKFLLAQKEFDTLDKYGTSLENAANSLNNLLDNLLKWTMQQRGMLPYKPISLNILEAIEEILQAFEDRTNEKNIELRIIIPEITIAYVDPNAFTSIIRNLIDNAIKFTPNEGLIELTILKKSPNTVIRLKDSGVGIAKEKLSTIFDLKKQKSTQGTAGEQGTGLGLNLVRELVLLNKGMIKAESQEGIGTLFEIVLPTTRN